MQKTTTLTKLKLFFGKMLPVLVLLAFSGIAGAQPFINGNLNTGATSSNGTAAPAGYTWSEVQAGNGTGGLGANIAANISMIDDFTVPGGTGWSLSKLTFWAYSSGFTGTTSPFNDVRIQIFNTDPSVGNPTPVYGDLTTNRFAATSDGLMYRIFNATPGTTRHIWKVEANVSKVLGPGHYWIEWQLGNGGLSNFSPPSTVVGTTTQAGNNAMQHDVGLGTFLNPVTDATSGTAQDMPFRIDYSIVAAPPCTPATAAVISAVNTPLTQGFDAAAFPATWSQTNNSAPLGTTNWTVMQNAAAPPFNSHSGAGYISANFNNTAGTGTISDWLLSPALTLKNGDKFSFWTRTTDGTFPDRLQVRMSTNGNSTNVGTGATGVGDFSNLLLDINPTYTSTGYPIVWTKFTVTISGVPAAGVSGRMAFRYFVEGGGPTGNNSDFMGIDDVDYTSSDAPTVCSGAISNIKVDITGGTGPFTVVYKATPPGTNVTVNNYTSGANIPVTPTANTCYTLVSVTGIDGCLATGLSGSGCVNVTSGSTAAVLSQVTLPPVPATLINESFTTAIPLPAGWAQQNLSNPVGATAWFQGNTAVFAGNTGGYIAANFNNTTGTNTISDWLFAPNVTLKNGDVLKFWTRTTTGAFPDRLQVRLSTNGASVNAGASNTSVGDFTTLLTDINPTYTATGYPTAWTQFSITLSGLPAAGVSGRIAFRYFVEGGGPGGNNSDYIGIDDVTYSTVVPGAPPTTCTGSTANLQVNITGGTSPYTVTITPTSPAGAPFTITNYVSGAPIPVTPAVTTTYALTSVVSAAGCTGTGNSGTPTVTVSPTVTTPLTIVDNPTGPLCAGDPKLLTVMAGSGLTTFASGASAVTIPATGSGAAAGSAASIYPVNNTVSGLATSGVTLKSVTLRGLSHTWMSDIDIVLQSPTGQNVIIMSDAGQGGDFVNHTLTFDDAAAAPLNNTTGGTNPPASGTTWKPTNLVDYLAIGQEPDNWPAPGPLTAPTSTTLGSFTGNFNGVWKLFISDDGGGDTGSMTGGYDLVFTSPSAVPVGYTYLWSPAAGLSSTTTNPVAASPMTTTTYQVLGTAPNGCQTTAQITINVNQLPSITTPPANTTVCEGGTATFSAVGAGAGITYQWQYATAAAPTTWINVPAGAPYTGQTTNTLTINPVTNAMNGFRYRLGVSGTCPPTAYSAAGILTVNPLPVITITPGSTCGGVAGINGVLLTATSPTGTGFTWSPTTGLYTNATATNPYTGGVTSTVYAAPAVNTTYTVTATNSTTGCVGTATVLVNFTPGVPTVTPAAATICLTTPKTLQQLQITSALAGSTTTVYSSGTVNLAVPDNSATPTLSNINVTLPAGAVISDYFVTLNMSHTYPGDMIFNLKAPNGTIANLYKYNGGNATGASSGVATWGWYNAQINGTSTTPFSSVAVAPFIYKTPPTVFKPDLLNSDVTGVGFPFNNPTGYVSTATNMSQLLATNPAGTWTLAMADGGVGDVGTLASWSLSFTYSAPTQGIWSVAGSPGTYTGLYTDATGGTAYTGAPANIVYASPAVTTTYQVTVSNGACPSQPRTVVVTVNTPITITTQPTNQSVCTDKAVSFTTVATGSAITHNWQVSTNNGNTFTNIANGAPYSGANTGTLTITAPPVSMNGYLYRDSLSTTPCSAVKSLIVRLTVNPLPIVTLTANPTALLPGVRTTITGSSTPSISQYQWFRNNALVSSGTLASPSPQITYQVGVDGIGTYTLRVTDINGCVNTSAGLLIKDSSSGRVFISPTPNNGSFIVRYYSTINNTGLARGVNIYDDKGAKVFVQKYTINAPYAPMAVDMRKFSTGTYWVEVVDVNGNRLAMGRTEILR